MKKKASPTPSRQNKKQIVGVEKKESINSEQKKENATNSANSPKEKLLREGPLFFGGGSGANPR